MKCQARWLTPLTITPLRQVHPLHLIELRRLPGIMTLAAKDNHGADSTTIAAPHVSVASVAEFAFATWMHSDAGNNLRSQDDNCPSHLNTHHRMHWPLNPFFTSQDLQRKTRPQLPQTRVIAPAVLMIAMAGDGAHPSGASYRNSSLSSATSSSSSVSCCFKKRSFKG